MSTSPANSSHLLSLDLSLVLHYQEQSQTKEAYYLTKEDTNHLLQEIGTALGEKFPHISKAGLIGIGSIYHLHQLIQPNFSIYQALFDIAKTRFTADYFQPEIIGLSVNSSINSHANLNTNLSPNADSSQQVEESPFPIATFVKKLSDYQEPIQALPLQLIIPASKENKAYLEELNEQLTATMELPHHMPEFLTQRFKVALENIHLTTLVDLTGFYATQLMHIGLDYLWDIMKAAIFNLPQEELRTLGSGHILYWDGKKVLMLTVHKSIFRRAMKDYEITPEIYRVNTMRFEHLFKVHNIPFARQEVFEPSFFHTAPATLAMVKAQINQHIQAL